MAAPAEHRSPNPIAGYEDWPAAVRGARAVRRPDRRRHRAGRGAGAARAAADSQRGGRGSAGPGRGGDSSVALVRRLRAGHHRMVVAADRSDRAISPGCWACTAMAACGRSAVSNWSSSGMAPSPGRRNCARAGIRAAPPPTSWPAGASPCWFTTRSPGAAAGSICPIPRHDSRPPWSAYAAWWREQELTPSRGRAVRPRLRTARGHAGQGGRDSRSDPGRGRADR